MERRINLLGDPQRRSYNVSNFVAAADFNRLHSQTPLLVHSQTHVQPARRESADVGNSFTNTTTATVSEGGEEGEKEGDMKTTKRKQK